MKKIKQYMCCIVLSTMLWSSDIYTDTLFNDNNFIFDNNWLPETSLTTYRSQATPQDILPILIEIGILDLLQADIYKRTNRRNVRNLLDYPTYIPIKYTDATWQTTAYLFYNHLDRGFYTRTSDKISSYLGVCDPKLLEFLSNEFLQEIIKTQFPNFNLDPLDVLPLFKNMTTQLRRVGCMFQGMRKFSNKQRFRFIFPVYYLESNFWLTEDEQRAVEMRFGPAENDDFSEEHLISDKVGFGDLRFMYDRPLVDRSFFHLRGGAFITIPVSFPFKRGIKGTHFSKKNPQNTLNILDFFCKANGSPEEQAMAAREGLCFFLNAIDYLSANLIEIPLGNDRHLGIGGYLRYKSYLRNFIPRPWAHDVHFNSYISLELLFPKRHRRFYIEKDDQTEFAALCLNKSEERIQEKIADDPGYAAQVLAFLDSQLTQKFFPFSLRTRVWPGFVFHWTTKAHYEGIRWGLELGTDTWVQAKEHLSHIKKPKNIPQDLNVKIARKPIAYQWKLFGSIFYKYDGNNNNWIFGLSGDYSFAYTGIGSDYTIAFVIEKHF